MTYTAKNIAHYIVTYCEKKNRPVSNLKLQKMLYFLWIEYFKHTRCELYLDDICAWKLGPVVPDVYYEFCSYAGMPISVELPFSIDEQDVDVLDATIEKYLPMAASTLVDKTHAKGKPWDIVYKDGLGNRDVIPFSLIKDLECTA
ncbi:MAG: Panacea domain-containing protein [Lawsonibacter sp.]|jgi:uncharacterized phage-associated protein